MIRELSCCVLVASSAFGASFARADGKPEEPAPPPPGALVRFDSTRVDTIIERRSNRTEGFSFSVPPAYVFQSQWEPVCVTPCEVRLDPNSPYRVRNVAPAGDFYLPRVNGPLRLHVNAGSSTAYYSGITLVVIGALAMISGAVLLGSTTTQIDAGTAHGVRISGWFTAGLGVVMTGIGLPLWLANITRVTTDDGQTL
jgi:hypothetical protein